MKLPAPFIELPIRFDSAALAVEVAGIEESRWRPHPNALPGNSMLPLIAVGGDPADEGFAGTMLPTPELRRCPYLMQVLAALGATLGRTRLMRLAGKAEVTRHVDQGYYWAERVRVHVPIVTQPSVRFECGDAAVNMAAGQCWIFDTWRQHRVVNDTEESRIHLVADTVGGAGFWDMVSRGRAVPGPARPDWRADPIAPQPGILPTLATESVNVPAVMSPWELNSHLRLLFSDALEHPRLPAVRMIAQRCAFAWQGLWAQYGNSAPGRPHYRRALDKFVEEVREPSRDIMLRNGVSWFSAMGTLIAKAAIADQAAADESYGTSDRA